MFVIWKAIVRFIGEMIYIQTICIWYFSKRKQTVKLPVFDSAKMIFNFHIGTIIAHVIYTLLLGPFIFIMNKIY